MSHFAVLPSPHHLWVVPIAPPQELRGDGVTVRPMVEEDVGPVASYACDPNCLTGTWLPLGEPAAIPALWAAWFVHEANMGWSRLGGRYGGGLAVDTDEVRFAGWVNFIPIRPGVVELCYGVAPPYRGQGIATAATQLAADWALGVGFDAVDLEIAAHHRESQRVATKAGFALVERFQKTVESTGHTYDDLRFRRTT